MNLGNLFSMIVDKILTYMIGPYAYILILHPTPLESQTFTIWGFDLNHPHPAGIQVCTKQVITSRKAKISSANAFTAVCGPLCVQKRNLDKSLSFQPKET